MVIPEPDLSLLTPLERKLFGSRIRRRYYADAVKYKERFKKDLYYDGMLYKLRNLYAGWYFGWYFFIMIGSWVVYWPAVIMRRLLILSSYDVSIFYHYFIIPVTSFIIITTFPITKLGLVLNKAKRLHRESHGIPQDRRTKSERRETPDRYC
jgi:hypothetical protein